MTSDTLSVTDLDKTLAAFMGAIALPSPKSSAEAAYVINPCGEAFPSQSAKRAPRDMAGGLMTSIMMQVADNGEAKPEPATAATAPPAHYCADPAAVAEYGAYRNGDAAIGYVVALGDAGTAVNIAPDGMAALVDTKKAGQFAMTLSTVSRRITYAPFATIPTVAQVIDAVNNDGPIAATDRPVGNSKNRNIEIAPN